MLSIDDTMHNIESLLNVLNKQFKLGKTLYDCASILKVPKGMTPVIHKNDINIHEMLLIKIINADKNRNIHQNKMVAVGVDELMTRNSW